LAGEAAAKHTVTEADRVELEKKVNRLLDARTDIIIEQKELATSKYLGSLYDLFKLIGMCTENRKVADHGNTSSDSMVSSPDAASISNEPDLFVAHVATVKLPEPESVDMKAIHELHAGRKTYHQCGAVILELKRGPSRLPLTKEEYWHKGVFILDDAIADLLLYCSAYFASYPEAKSVVAVAAAGPLWRWANIKRSDTPGWDFILNEPLDKDKALVLGWRKLFKSAPFTLGTPASDKELTIINQQQIHPLLDHTPEIPAHLKSDEEGDDEEDE
jgi:hypothetical protein